MEPVYARLSAACEARTVSLSEATAFGLDEYVGASADDTWSFHHFVHRHLVVTTDLPAGRAHLPDGMAEDIFAEAESYDEAIREAGGIDLQLLGLGPNGHIGFNEPGSSLGSGTRAKALTDETLAANCEALPSQAARPVAAITMGLGTILASRRCLVLAVGAAKATAVAGMIEGPVSARLPASILQHHPDVTVVVDEAAASKLEDASYYRRAEALQRKLDTDFTPRRAT
jgi:glucosamine-6-phosphate deaminase